ncbi:MAG: TonB family protein [Solirubrobacteraceae bacterium]
MTFLFESTIKTSLVLAAGLAAAALLRRRSAALRHWVLTAAVLCAAITPLLQATMPAWHLPALSTLVGRRLAPIVLRVPVAYVQTEMPAAGGSAAEPRAASVARLVVPIWLGGASLSVAFLLIGLARLRWLAAHARPIRDGALREIADALALAGGGRSPALLLESDHPTLLVTWGLAQPKIVLPAAAHDWPAARARIVLAHELAHVARRDWLVQMAAELLRAACWFNPLAWIVCRRLRFESEHACDDAVLGLGVEGSDYAIHLLDIARASRRHPRTWLPAPGMARPSSLERRVRAMLNVRLNRNPMTRTAAVAIVVVLACVTIPLAGFSAAAQPAASFSGSLIDAVGRILPDVPMVLTGAESGQKYEAQSDRQGHFAFAGLPAGRYLLVAQKLGFTTEPARVTLDAGMERRQDVALQLGSVQERVVVRAVPGSLPPRRPTPPRPVPSWADHAAAAACLQASIGGCLKAPLKLKDVRPEYPERLEAAGGGGDVRLNGRIGADGFVHGSTVVEQADADLAKAAIDAVQQWEFRPTFLDGVPVEVGLQVHITFAPR